MTKLVLSFLLIVAFISTIYMVVGIRLIGDRVVFEAQEKVRHDLNAARELGDMLVIGLNSDKSVAALKPGRPVNPEASRAEVLSSLDAVDYVTVFGEDTPYALISFLRPDVLVKGGDWKREDVVGADIVRDTRILPYVEGVSTSLILEKIKNIPE